MDYRTFEVHYCLEHRQNICVEVTNYEKNPLPVKRCLYEETKCQTCPYHSSSSKTST